MRIHDILRLTTLRLSMLLAATIASDRKSTRLNSSHTEIYTLSLHDALPIWAGFGERRFVIQNENTRHIAADDIATKHAVSRNDCFRSEEHTSELQSHRDLHSFPTRRSSDLGWIR